MFAILVFLDGTLCDARQRYSLSLGTAEFDLREALLADAAVPGSAPHHLNRCQQ